MTRTRRIVTASIIAAVLAAAAIIGAHLHDGAVTGAVTSALTTTAASPTEATATNAATPTPTATTVTVPAAGATIPADQVAAVRKAGGHVYVSPNGTGDGLVVAAGRPLPQVVLNDWNATGATQVVTTAAAESARIKAMNSTINALVDLNLPIVAYSQMGTFKDGKLIDRFWTYGIFGVPNNATINGSLPHQPTRAAALGAARKLAAQYGAQVTDIG